MIPVKVKEVVLDQTHSPLLLLVDFDEAIVLPVGIGFWEAQAIIMKLQGSLLPRPMTHDLMSSICSQLGAHLSKIIINDIRDDTFFAELYFDKDGDEIVIDARPSDAVALALTVGSPIYITDKVAAYTISIDDLVEEKGVFDFDDSDESGPHLH